ncbi:hypothetical protein PMAYCL1PPCAC_06025, partial [Pristionchus mayeri]
VTFNLNDVLGYGSMGTTVYKGKLNDAREVAVKRVLNQNQIQIDREVKALIETDSHDNVIRYFDMESDSYFHYLTLELCIATLHDYVEKKSEIKESSVLAFAPVEILRQISKGLAHLHSKTIVHRDLKPENVLFCNRGGTMRAVISDFGLCKKHRPDMHSLSKGSGTVGTYGWTAPEALKGESTVDSYPMDIFSLGCIFYYVLTGGSHPFGDPILRTSHIYKGLYKLRGLKDESKRLIALTLSAFPASRPSAITILLHPLFWGMKEQLDFFCIVS